MSTVHLLIRGKVQGVFFRASAKDKALEFGVSGWVRNKLNGAVEIMASGDAEALQKFVNWCRKGPPDARVSWLEQIPCKDETFSDFKIIR